MLSPKGSSSTCIPEGQTTFLHAACTAHHALHPTELVTTRSARPLRIRATDGKIHGNDQFTLTNDDNQEDPINAREHPVFLATPPGAHQAQLFAVLFEDRVIAH